MNCTRRMATQTGKYYVNACIQIRKKVVTQFGLRVGPVEREILRSAEKLSAQDDTVVYETQLQPLPKGYRTPDLHSGSGKRYSPGEADPSRCEQQQLPRTNRPLAPHIRIID